MSAAKPAIAVLGAGSWGTALASLLARHGYPTVLWGRDASQIDAIEHRIIHLCRCIPAQAIHRRKTRIEHLRIVTLRRYASTPLGIPKHCRIAADFRHLHGRGNFCPTRNRMAQWRRDDRRQIDAQPGIGSMPAGKIAAKTTHNLRQPACQRGR